MVIISFGYSYKTTVFTVFYFADFVLKPRIVYDFTVYAMFYLKEYFTLSEIFFII